MAMQICRGSSRSHSSPPVMGRVEDWYAAVFSMSKSLLTSWEPQAYPQTVHMILHSRRGAVGLPVVDCFGRRVRPMAQSKHAQPATVNGSSEEAPEAACDLHVQLRVLWRPWANGCVIVDVFDEH
ncbi:hypothetical protein P154DRAFT_574971 [Amniculicola lignicola CBS 123094]|uniref:Uncharacterized protein n=1 Tax=Amniculicola lignicola CBS 123094 TaxID=1392246 RepID=A0A6A5WRB4_9PLEO|nr:hypothetical protein P154DRAFT_574971 [Amniculicola lignicola CBS 123094]